MSVERSEVHRLLLNLAGRVPDAELAGLRTCLADDELDEIADVLIAGGFALSEWEQEMLAGLAAEHGVDPGPLASTPRPENPVTWRFVRNTTVDSPAGDAAAVRAADGVGGLRALWRAIRLSKDIDAPARAAGDVVYLGEAAADADVVELTAEIQHRLAEAGQTPRVEVFAEGAELTGYHEAALAVAELTWTAAPPRAHLARVFDGTDTAGTPFFRPDHHRLDQAERDRLLAYLRAGPVVLATDGRMDDVLDPDQGAVVALNFRSDGTWIWNDAVCHYLERHWLEPDPDLVAHVAAAGAPPSGLSKLDLHCVRDALSLTATEE
ncbi:hypothetical protein SAMN05216215_103538 [Saccharopolyspora shandongensis]|uniref:Uncharacterized protein n=1 Tax=Saccharopolyspora shandongensis TaxID=418495 RepID=A0A1H3MSX6_9PSEU|nr:hypothetical protein [Saccharopolyspora shandongensis]SDY79528.1 hypothetical protein SAMN05216215_103538 [Saccharopolyspora shandongensis]